SRVAENHLVHGRQIVRQIEYPLEMLADVIRVHHRVFRGLADSRTISKGVGKRPKQDAEISAISADAPNRPRTIAIQSVLAILFLHNHRDGQKRLENLLHHPRSRAWSTAAMRRRKSLVQIEVHHVHAEIPG